MAVKWNMILRKYSNRDNIIIISFLAFSSLYKFDLFSNLEFHEFNRIQGMATSQNIDISKLIHSFYILFILTFIAFFIFWNIVVFTSYHLDKTCKIGYGSILHNISTISLFGLISLFFSYLVKYNTNRELISVFVYFSFSSILLYFCFVLFKRKNMLIVEWNDFIWIFLTTITASFVIVAFIPGYINVILPSIFFLLLLICDKLKKKNYLDRIKFSFIPFHYSILCIMILSEFCVILNQNNIFLKDSRVFYFIAVFIIMCSCIFRFIKKEATLDSGWENKSYLGIVLSIAFFIGLPSIAKEVNTDLYEQANTALPLSQLFSYGKVPLIETHSAHLLSDFIYGLIYKIVNRDLLGSFFGLYNGFDNSIALVILYYVIKNFFRNEYALFFVLFFPFFTGTQMLWGSVCFVAMLAFVNLLKKKTTCTYYLFWFILAFVVLYKGDLGLAVGLGCVLTLFTIMILQRGELSFRKVVESFCVILLFFLITYTLICLMKGIHPLNRFVEFLTIMAKSNQNWAYGSIGDTNLIAFSVVYMFIPTLIIGIIVWLIWSMYKNKHNGIDYKIVILLVLAFSYIVNFPRSLVRHSLIERSVINLLFTSVLLISLCYGNKKDSFRRFILAYFVVVFISFSFSSFDAVHIKSVFDVASERINNPASLSKNLGSKRINRTMISNEMKSTYGAISEEIINLLEDDETFLDFTNQTMLYSLTNKENPVYINQSPGFLTDEFTQKEFIKQLKSSDKEIPVALLAVNPIKFGTEIDGIKNTYRYYLVAEYIFQNYDPVEIVGDYAIWIKKERLDLKEKVANNNIDIDIADFSKGNLILKNTTIMESNELIFENGSDPYIENFEELIPNITSSNISISIDYESDIEGEVKLYYAEKNKESFDEEKTVSSKIVEGNGKVVFTVPYCLESAYRLDMNDYSQFKIKKVSIGNQRIDATYLNEENQNYSLGSIPYLWGNLDTKNATSNEIIMPLNAEGGIYNLYNADIEKDNGNYLSMVINAKEDKNINIELGKVVNDENIKITNYNFDLKNGENTYLIRISNNAHWYNNQYDYLKLYLSELEIKDVKLLKGD